MWGQSWIRLSQPTTNSHGDEPGPKKTPINVHDTQNTQRIREAPLRTLHPDVLLHDTLWSSVPDDAQASARDECVVVVVVCFVFVFVFVFVVVVVEWLHYSKRIIIVRWADLSDFFVHFRR